MSNLLTQPPIAVCRVSPDKFGYDLLHTASFNSCRVDPVMTSQFKEQWEAIELGALAGPSAASVCKYSVWRNNACSSGSAVV